MANLSHQIATRQTLGILGLRHHDDQLEVPRRALLAAGRVVYDQETGQARLTDVGDVQSFLYWPAADEGERQAGEGGERGSWSASFSAVVSQATAATASPPVAQGFAPRSLAFDGGPNLMLPTRLEWEPAERYRQIGIGRPSHGSEVLPRGLSGIVTAAMDEDEQRPMFHPDFVGLFAPSRWGDPRAGTVIYDLGQSGEIDDTRSSRLQQILETVDLGAERVPALVLSYSRLGGGRGGLHVVDHRWGMVGVGDGDHDASGTASPSPSGSLVRNTDPTLVAGGPFVVGPPEFCRHADTAPRDADGRPVVPLHLSTAASYLAPALDGIKQDGPLPFFPELLAEDLDVVPFFSIELRDELLENVYREALILYSEEARGFKIISRDTFTTANFAPPREATGSTTTRRVVTGGGPQGVGSGRPRAPGGRSGSRQGNGRNPGNGDLPWDPAPGAGGGRRRPQRPAGGGGAPDPYKRGLDPTEDDRRWLYEQPFSPLNPNQPTRQLGNPAPNQANSGAGAGAGAGGAGGGRRRPAGGAGGGRRPPAGGAIAGAAGGAGAAIAGVAAGGGILPAGATNAQEGDAPGEYAFSPFCVAAPNYTWTAVPTSPSAIAIGNGVGLNGQALEEVRSQVRPAATMDAFAAGGQTELDSTIGADGAYHASSPVLSLRPTAVRRADVLAGLYDPAGVGATSPVSPVRWQIPAGLGSLDLAHPALDNASGSSQGGRVRQAADGDGLVLVALDANGNEVGDELAITSAGATLGGSAIATGSGGGSGGFGGSGEDGATTYSADTSIGAVLNATTATVNATYTIYPASNKPIVIKTTGAYTLNGTAHLAGRGYIEPA